MSNRIDYAKVSSAGYTAFGGVYVYLQNSGLPKELIYLVYLRVSQINGCAYCIDMHSRDLLKLSVTVKPPSGCAAERNVTEMNSCKLLDATWSFWPPPD
jgi:AhpD family alkylhydroperoxidase